MATSTVRTEQANTQEKQPVSNRRIVRIQAPVDGQPEKLHLDGVWRIRLTGPGAWSYTNTELRDFLIKNKLVRRLEDWNDAVFYQLGHPGEKYVALPPGSDSAFSHGIELEIQFDDTDPTKKGKIRIEDPKIKDNRCTLSFVAPSASKQWVHRLLDQIGLQPINLFQGKRKDMWHFATIVPMEDIPHYLTVEGDSFNQHILLQVFGRWIECFHCGSIDHRSNACKKENEKKKKIEEYKKQKDKEDEIKKTANQKEKEDKKKNKEEKEKLGLHEEKLKEEEIRRKEKERIEKEKEKLLEAKLKEEEIRRKEKERIEKEEMEKKKKEEIEKKEIRKKKREEEKRLTEEMKKEDEERIKAKKDFYYPYRKTTITLKDKKYDQEVKFDEFDIKWHKARISHKIGQKKAEELHQRWDGYGYYDRGFSIMASNTFPETSYYKVKVKDAEMTLKMLNVPYETSEKKPTDDEHWVKIIKKQEEIVKENYETEEREKAIRILQNDPEKGTWENLPRFSQFRIEEEILCNREFKKRFQLKPKRRATDLPKTECSDGKKLQKKISSRTEKGENIDDSDSDADSSESEMEDEAEGNDKSSKPPG